MLLGMPKRKKPALEYYLGSCQEMQDWPIIYPDALYLMLSDQLNKVGPGKGYVPRVMSAFGERTYEVKVVQGKLSLVITADWDYLEANTPAPNVNELRKLVVDMRIQQVFSKSNTKVLSITVTVDLTRWKNLANGILHSHILSYTGHVHSTPLHACKLKREVDYILKHHYPSLEAKFLLIAADMGETPESADDFVSWLENPYLAQSGPSANVPVDLC